MLQDVMILPKPLYREMHPFRLAPPISSFQTNFVSPYFSMSYLRTTFWKMQIPVYMIQIFRFYAASTTRESRRKKMKRSEEAAGEALR